MDVPRAMKIYKPRRDSHIENYKELYRFRKENVEWMAGYFLVTNEEKRGGALSNKEKMRTFLRYIGDPGFQIGVADDAGVNQSTVSRTISEVLLAIESKADYWIKFPTTPQAMMNAKIKWQEKYTFPDDIGAIDCTHVLIKKPH